MGRLFVNNVSLGIYATIVQQDSYRAAKLETTKELLPDLLGRPAEPFDLQFTDARRLAGGRGLHDPGLEQPLRTRQDAGGIHRGGDWTPDCSGSLRSRRHRCRGSRVVTRSTLGQQGRTRTGTSSPRRPSRSAPGGKAFAGVDGEALELPTPLAFTIHPGGLRLLVPEGNLAVAVRRRARDVSLGSVVAVARGVEPLDP